MTNDSPQAPARNEKRMKRIVIVLLVIILGLIAALIWQSVSTGEKIEQKVTENISLQSELDSLMREHDFIKYEYGALTDSLKSRDSVILANAEEIKKLIASQADYYRIRKKLDLLRGITQNYVNRIDSLYTANRLLEEENRTLSTKYEEQVSITEELEKDRTELEEKVTQAAVLKAYNIVCEGIRMRAGEREDVTFKARRVDAIRVSFTLSENPVAEPGPKTLYVRIARPDNVIVTRGKDDAFTFEYEGNRINFSMKEEIDYQNKALDVQMHWNKQTEEPAMKGVYSVSIYADGREIGFSQFELE